MKNVSKKSKKKTKGTTIMVILGAAVAIGILGYVGISSMIPANSNFPVFAAPTNLYIKSLKTSDRGYIFASQSIKGGKGVPLTGTRSPTFVVNKGNLISLHLINEDKDSIEGASLHNINIDEFKVHSKNLRYFEADTVTFVADKDGQFDYYCSLHPEMKGTLEVRVE